MHRRQRTQPGCCERERPGRIAQIADVAIGRAITPVQWQARFIEREIDAGHVAVQQHEARTSSDRRGHGEFSTALPAQQARQLISQCSNQRRRLELQDFPSAAGIAHSGHILPCQQLQLRDRCQFAFGQLHAEPVSPVHHAQRPHRQRIQSGAHNRGRRGNRFQHVAGRLWRPINGDAAWPRRLERRRIAVFRGLIAAQQRQIQELDKRLSHLFVRA